MQGREGDQDQQKLWDATYQSKLDFFGARPSEMGESALKVLKERGVRSVLELGCGQGRDTWLFLQNGLEVIAIDYSMVGICQMQERAGKEGGEDRVRLEVQDARKGIPLPDSSVDAIYSHMFFTMQLTEEEVLFILKECRRVLKPGGINIYSVRNDHDPQFQKGKHMGEDMWQNPMGFVVHYYSEDKIRRLAKGYDLLWVKEFEDPTPPSPKKLYEVALQKPR